MDIKQLKNIIQTTFPGLSINNFSILGDGKYAYACLVNDKIVFKIPKLEDEYMNDQDKEVNILQHLANKLCVRIPEILYSGNSIDDKYIIGESFLNGITYTQELHDYLIKRMNVMKSDISTSGGNKAFYTADGFRYEIGSVPSTGCTQDDPCIILVDVNGDRGPTTVDDNSYLTGDNYPTADDKEVPDCFYVMISDVSVQPYGAVAQRTMYQPDSN